MAMDLVNSLAWAQSSPTNENTRDASKNSIGLLDQQAQERKTFYDSLAAERKALKDKLAQDRHSLLEKQRTSRKNFEPDQHSVDQRRDFYIQQRMEMQEFNHKAKEAERLLKQDQKSRLKEFHNNQKMKRYEKLRALPSRVISH